MCPNSPAPERPVGSSLGAPSGGRRRLKTSEVVASSIAKHISDNQLEEGTRLPSEVEMAGSFQVGRTTMREALRLLETQGAISIRSGPHGGPIVRRPRPSDFSRGLTLLLQFEQASLADVITARAALEPTLAGMAAAQAGPDLIATLEGTVARMVEGAGDQECFTRENTLFHGGIAAASGSAVLRIFSESLQSIADGGIAGVRYNARHHIAVSKAHQRIIDALKEQDAANAERTMRDHLNEVDEYWQRRFTHLMETPVTWLQ